MAANKFQKFLYSIELQGSFTSRHRAHGRKLNPVGWARESALPGTAPYESSMASITAPNARITYANTGEDRSTPADTMLERDYHVTHGNIIGAAARQAQARRAAGM